MAVERVAAARTLSVSYFGLAERTADELMRSGLFEGRDVGALQALQACPLGYAPESGNSRVRDSVSLWRVRGHAVLALDSPLQLFRFRHAVLIPGRWRYA